MASSLAGHLIGWARSLTYSRPDWWGELGRREVRGDVAAGLTVGVMLVPQSMAYATLGGLPPLYGLYASLIPLIVYPFFGTARQLAVGVVALDMLVVGTGLAGMAPPESGRYVELAILLAALLGVIQLAMSALRLGFLADLLSRPVVTGFTSAAALVIAASQLGPLLGLELPRSEFIHRIVMEAAPRLSEVHPGTALLGGIAVVVLLALRRWVPAIPGGAGRRRRGGWRPRRGWVSRTPGWRSRVSCRRGSRARRCPRCLFPTSAAFFRWPRRWRSCSS